MKRRWALGLLSLCLGGATLSVAMLFAHDRIGRTPGEIITYAKHRVQGHGLLERAALPLLGSLERLLGAPSAAELRLPFAVPSLPPNPLQPATSASPPVRDARVLRVGPQRELSSIAMAAGVARDGDLIEVDAGDYFADVAVWDRAEITIRGVGQRVRLIAAGAHAEGKAIWVVRRGKVTVENIDFIGTRVPDGNGAGIRFEGGHLILRRCFFYDNQNGVITGNDADALLEIENSEFGYNGAGDGLSHNLYVGAIRALTVTASYFHHANAGHLLKSRARANYVHYNRLTDEAGGRSSYEMEFPNGGLAQVLGNIVEQGVETRNSVMISFGAEGYRWPSNQLVLAFNTVVNNQPAGGTFIQVAKGAGKVVTRNNLFVGKGLIGPTAHGDSAGDVRVDWSFFVRPSREDYRLSSKALSRFVSGATGATDPEMTPLFEYEHPAKRRRLEQPAYFPGAMQTAPR